MARVENKRSGLAVNRTITIMSTSYQALTNNGTLADIDNWSGITNILSCAIIKMVQPVLL